MTKLIATAVTTAAAHPALAAGLIFAGLRFTCADSNGNPIGSPVTVAAPGPYTAEFDNLGPGQYSIIAVSVDSAGNSLSSPMSGSGIIPLPDITIDVPANIQVALS